MSIKLAKRMLEILGIDYKTLYEQVSGLSIRFALKKRGNADLLQRLKEIVPDISNQESSEKDSFNDYLDLKRRALQAFQCALMLKALEGQRQRHLRVADIGDSAGTHMLYLKALTAGTFEVDTVSVNLDPRAIEKIENRGLRAVLCRAEEIEMSGFAPDLFTSFQMVEHLHNPAIFFRRLAKKSKCSKMVITVPFMRSSRVGLHHTKRRDNGKIFAEDEHIFELSPEDWTLLLLHSGWKVLHSEVYYQYPRSLPVFSQLLAWYWRKFDFEGFWGAILEKDTAISDRYQDWEE